MSTLTLREKKKLEQLFQMSSGYVLNFSNRTFGDFFAELDIDIHADKYGGDGVSKANKLRSFWEQENDHLVGKVLLALIGEAEDPIYPKDEHYSSPIAYLAHSLDVQRQAKDVKEIANRLLSGKVNLEHLKQTATTFSARHLSEQIKRMESAINDDPALAIGTAKELIETCCKTILSERGKSIEGSPNIPVLTKATLKELNLVPENIDDHSRGSDVIKRLLSNLGTIGNGLAELRGLYGTGHGKEGKSQGLQPRHAKLAVGAAATLAIFLFDTHEETKAEK